MTAVNIRPLTICALIWAHRWPAGDLQDGVVTCPWHAWRFQVCDGTWCDNRRIKIDHFDLRVVGEEIQVRVRPKEDRRTEA